MTTLDERVLEASIGTLELFAIHLGKELGLYERLNEAGPMTPPELAAAAGIDLRYAREWLEQQAVAGYLNVFDQPADGAGPEAANQNGSDADRRRFGLDDEQKAVLVRADDPAHLSPLASMVVGVSGALDQVVEAYRTGDGVPYVDYGHAFRAGQAGVNRPAFTHDLVASWIPSVDGLDERLRRPGARIADLGCGFGWSTVALGRGYPDATVVALDSDEASMIEAAKIVAERGVDVELVTADASELVDHGPFDLVTILESLHDMADPVTILRAAAEALAPGGTVLVADECVADHFAPNGDELERMMYGWSVVHCLPACRCEAPSAAIGTVIRRSTVEELAAEAGFSTVTVPDVDAGFFRLYALTR